MIEALWARGAALRPLVAWGGLEEWLVMPDARAVEGEAGGDYTLYVTADGDELAVPLYGSG